MKEKSNKKKGSFLWLMSVCFIAVGLLLFCQFYFGNTVHDNTTFYSGTQINGVNVSGMTKREAQNLLSTTLAQSKEDISIRLVANDDEYEISGIDLQFVGNFDDSLDKILSYGHEGNIFEKRKIQNEIKKNGLITFLPYEDMLGGLDEKVEEILQKVEATPTSSFIQFNPNEEKMFSLKPGVVGYIVNRDELKKNITDAISKGSTEAIDIPLQEVLPKENLEELISQISLRSQFSTDYSKSSQNRKSNIKTALAKFNGMIVEPQKFVSFNQVTGARNSENGYKDAKIIVDGNYVSGVAGGVCQASSTLYNALLLSDIEVTKVFHHSLPASYVPLSFDAMVSEGYADLEFKNNLDTPIFIKAYGTDTSAIVEIYGQPFENGEEIKTRSELVKVIAHEGDTIVKDLRGEYSNKVLYEGEYYRLKYPQEGYESKGFIQYYKNGTLQSEKEIRHDKYLSQKGIIIEGSSSLEEGMNLPQGDVKYISPQKVTSQTIENAKKRWNAV